MRATQAMFFQTNCLDEDSVENLVKHKTNVRGFSHTTMPYFAGDFFIDH